MSAENKERLSGTSDLQRKINQIAHLESLEGEGIHAHSLAKEIDPNLADEVTNAHNQHESTFTQRNDILTRRRSRRIVKLLTKRGR